jgi:hypothetical protein
MGAPMAWLVFVDVAFVRRFIRVALWSFVRFYVRLGGRCVWTWCLCGIGPVFVDFRLIFFKKLDTSSILSNR